MAVSSNPVQLLTPYNFNQCKLLFEPATFGSASMLGVQGFASGDAISYSVNGNIIEIVRGEDGQVDKYATNIKDGTLRINLKQNSMFNVVINTYLKIPVPVLFSVSFFSPVQGQSIVFIGCSVMRYPDMTFSSAIGTTSWEIHFSDFEKL